MNGAHALTRVLIEEEILTGFNSESIVDERSDIVGVSMSVWPICAPNGDATVRRCALITTTITVVIDAITHLSWRHAASIATVACDLTDRAACRIARRPGFTHVHIFTSVVSVSVSVFKRRGTSVDRAKTI